MLESGICDYRIEGAEALERRIDDRPVALLCRQVAVVDVDRVHRPAVPLEPAHDSGADPARGAGDERCGHLSGASQRYWRKTSSAAQTGFSCPSRSAIPFRVSCIPPSISSTVRTVKRPRIRLPTGTGAGNRTLLTP